MTDHNLSAWSSLHSRAESQFCSASSPKSRFFAKLLFDLHNLSKKRYSAVEQVSTSNFVPPSSCGFYLRWQLLPHGRSNATKHLARFQTYKVRSR